MNTTTYLVAVREAVTDQITGGETSDTLHVERIHADGLDAAAPQAAAVVAEYGGQADVHYADLFEVDGDGEEHYAATVDMAGHRHQWQGDGHCSGSCGAHVDDYPSLVDIDWWRP
jgi:hypothetical protein